MNDYFENPEYLALLATVRANPKDVAPKLILADYIQEAGHDDRAEWIRNSVAKPAHSFSEWVKEVPSGNRNPLVLAGINKEGGVWFWRSSPGGVVVVEDASGVEYITADGFVSEVRLECRRFIGDTCNKCDGKGFHVDYVNHSSVWGRGDVPCKQCDETGMVFGLAKKLFLTHPIVKVVLTDKKPILYSANSSSADLYSWQATPDPADTPSGRIPDPIFEKIDQDPRYVFNAYYSTEELAQKALSEACVNYGRSLVGLPEFENDWHDYLN